MKTLTCNHCGQRLFEKIEAGQYRYKPEWLERGLPLPKVVVDEWSQGGGIAYRCLNCGTLANTIRTEMKLKKSNFAVL